MGTPRTLRSQSGLPRSCVGIGRCHYPRTADAVGPLAGVAYNLTLLSYNHSLDMGVNIDTAAVTEPELLRECLEKAFADLISA